MMLKKKELTIQCIAASHTFKKFDHSFQLLMLSTQLCYKDLISFILYSISNFSNRACNKTLLGVVHRNKIITSGFYGTYSRRTEVEGRETLL